MHTNRLAQEKSPYLQQHAHNPVDWYPWGTEAFDKARAEDKPIFLSIGYSTCHWCHVMERESFESEEIAEVLNRYFVPVKVDREERPDVDRIYMTFVQATTGGGGWPMSVWLTPELKPFFGGTYFPPDSRWGRPGFRSVLEQLATAWQTDRAAIVKSGNDVLDELKKHISIEGPAYAVDEGVLDSCYYQFRRSFDSKYGGFGGAPKFPRASAFNFLLRYHKRTGNEEARDMVLFTLREMAKGGMMDHLGGGFHRYSVDARWFVPHFEKMLYDQAQIATSYIEAYQLSGEEEFAATARSTLEYVLRDMTHPDGGFYSAEDADSIIDPANADEKGEGAFYVWSREEIDRIAGAPAADWFRYRYGVEDAGNVAEDPHGEFRGKNILYKQRSIAETAARFGQPEGEVERAIAVAEAKLLSERAKRPRPHLDDKILTAWNGLMISAFAKAARALMSQRYLEAAQRATGLILRELYREGRLLRRYREGEAAIEGFLDDYAFLAQALVDLYEADFDGSHIRAARAVADRMIDLFEDGDNGGFYSTAEGDASLVMRIKEDYDGAEPGGNSVAISALLRLANLTGEERYGAVAAKALSAFAARMRGAPTALPQMLIAVMQSLTPPRHILLSGDRDAVAPMVELIGRRFVPFYTVAWAVSDGINPALARMPVKGTGATAYVCEDFVCNLPTQDVNKLAELLQ
jgi:uncharacterized protein YyaL (SSP411 family)